MSRPPFPILPRRPRRRFGDGGRLLLLLLAAVVPLLTGCATKGDVRDLRAEIERLHQRQDALLQELRTLAEANRDSLDRHGDVLFDLRGELGQQLVEIQAQLVTLQELTGQGQRNLAALRDQIEAQRTRFSQPPAESGDTLRGGEGAGREAGGDPPSAGGAEELYNAGIEQFNRGSFRTARRAFERFLQSYPTHSLAPDATFYLAQTMVQEGRHEEAVESFQRISELFPGSSRVPQALYRIGILYLEELGDTEEARRYLERVVNSYPDSGVAELAQERLDEIN